MKTIKKQAVIKDSLFYYRLKKLRHKSMNNSCPVKVEY